MRCLVCENIAEINEAEHNGLDPRLGGATLIWCNGWRMDISRMEFEGFDFKNCNKFKEVRSCDDKK